MKVFRVVSFLVFSVCLCALCGAWLRFDAAASGRASGERSRPSPDKTGKAQPMELADFDKRCHASGVLVCEGFDSADKFRPAKWPATGLYPSGDGQLRGTLDTSVKASGQGSLRFEIPPHSPANASGYWRQMIGKNFGAGTTYYVQFRQRFSREMLKNNFGDTTWKQALFHNGVRDLQRHRDRHGAVLSRWISNDVHGLRRTNDRHEWGKPTVLAGARRL